MDFEKQVADGTRGALYPRSKSFMSTPVPSKPTSESSELHLHELAANRLRNEAGPYSASTTDFIRKAVSDQADGDVARLVLPKGAGLIPAETLLAIVSYCYAKGIYGCRDIELAMLRDQELRESVRTDLPSDACLRRFRRLNRAAIQAILERTFVQAKRELGRIPPDHVENAGPGHPSGIVSAPPSDPGETTFLARQAAEDRIQKALFIDGMTRDA